MVEVPAGGIAELAAEAEAPVRERRLLEGEADRSLAGCLLPAEAGGVLGGGGQQQPGLIAQLERDPRRGDRLARVDAELDRHRLARRELLPRFAARAEQLDAGDARLAAPVL